MPAYDFATITITQAMSYEAISDSLVFSSPGASAGDIQVVYDYSTTAIAIISQGHTVVFGHGLAGETGITFPDGSTAFIGGAIQSNMFFGGGGNDALFSGLLGGELHGGDGNDTLVGGHTGVSMFGGPGADLFVFRSGDSTPLDALGFSTIPNYIEDLESGDRISFGPVAATAANYAEINLGPAPSQEDATAAANALIATGAADFVAVQVGYGVLLFADGKGDNGAADIVVTLSRGAPGFSLADLDFSQIVATPAQPAFPPIPYELAGAAAPGSGASGTVSGDMGAAQLHDLYPAVIDVASPTEFRADGAGGLQIDIVGHGLSYASGLIDTGSIDQITFVDVVGGATKLALSLTVPDIAAQQFSTWLVNDSIGAAYGALLKGNDTLDGAGGADLIHGGAGNDLITGGGGGDHLFGDDGHDTLVGGSSADHLSGGASSDLLTGGGGADVFEVGVIDSYLSPVGPAPNDLDHITDWTSHDFLQFLGGPVATSSTYVEIATTTLSQASSVAQTNFTQGIAYTVAQVGTDVVVFAPGDRDAVILSNVTLADISYANLGGDPASALAPPPVLPPAIDAAFLAVTRAASASAGNLDLANSISNGLTSGVLNQSDAIHSIVQAAENTSSVATLAYEFFTGGAPTAAGMDYLVSPTGPNPNNINSTYYQHFSLENRYINFAVNLGKVGEGNAAFTATYGGLSLFEATRSAYATIFGEAPSDAKLHAILDPTTVLNGVTYSRGDYFAYYGLDGPDGIGTKAAMVGWLLAEAEKADVGTYALSNDAFLTDVALHGAPFGVDLVGVYGQPGFVYHPG